MSVPAAFLARSRQPTRHVPAPAGDDPSLWQEVSQPVLSTFGAAGNFLDLPGSSARDLIASAATGRWHNPFDQYLTPFQDTNRITGRELTTKLGMTRPNNPDKWEWDDLGGFAAEVATDPLTYLSFGTSALTKSGRIAKSAGALEDASKVAKLGKRASRSKATLADLAEYYRGTNNTRRLEALDQAAKSANYADLAAAEADLAGQALGGYARAALPGTGIEHVFGQGSTAVTGRMDRAARALGASPPGRAFARIMHAPTREASLPPTVRLARSLTRGRERTIGEVNEMIGRQVTRLKDAGLATDDMADKLRKAFEYDTGRKSLPELQSMFDEVDTELSDLISRADASGLDLKELMDPELDYYFPRYAAKRANVHGSSAQAVTVHDPSEMGRLWFLKEIDNGTTGIKEILLDEDFQRLVYGGLTANERLASKAPLPSMRASAKAIAQYIDAKHGQRFTDFMVTAPKNRGQQISAFAKWARKLSPESMSTGVFGNHPLYDLRARMMHSRNAINAAEGIYEMLADPNSLAEAFQYARNPREMVSLGDALKQIGFKPKAAAQRLGQALGMPPDHAIAKMIPREMADDLARMAKSFTAPEAVNDFMSAVDSVTNITKAMLTGPWPAFHIRNLISGQFQNFMLGMFSPRSLREANALLRGKSPESLLEIPAVRRRLTAEGIAHTPQAAADMVRRMAQEQQLVGKYQGQFADIVGNGLGEQSSISAMLDEYPGGLGGDNPFQWGRTIKKAVGGGGATFDPREVRGFQGRESSRFAPVAAGEDVGYYAEGLNRIAPFIDQLRNGVDEFEAATRVKAAQVDYSGRKFTAFEKQGLQRLFPWYKFTSRMLPFTLQQLAEQPGGRFAKLIRAARLGGEQQGEPLPDYIAQTAAIPWGRAENGDPRYVTGFGMMPEDALGLMTPDAKQLGLELLSRTNPLIKGPLEYITGQSFFQRGPTGGRPLEDLDPTIGRTASNVMQWLDGQERRDPIDIPGSRVIEPLLLNSPASRFLTTLRTLSDPRKGLGNKASQLLTGVRTTDVNERMREAILRERATELMREFPESRAFERVYFPKDELATMEPGRKERAERLQKIMKVLGERAKQRKRDQETQERR